MSRCIDLFIHADAPADELASTIAQRTGLAVEHDPAQGMPVVVDGDVRAVLAEHPFDVDDDLVLSRYRWALTASSTAAGHLGDAPETRTLRKVSAALAPDHPVLLVLDLQYRSSRAQADPSSPQAEAGAA